jgi:hypothetical protein
MAASPPVLAIQQNSATHGSKLLPEIDGQTERASDDMTLFKNDRWR